LTFYLYIAPVHNKITICKFEDVTSDFSLTINQLNNKYNTQFKSPKNDDNARKLVTEKVEVMEIDHSGGELSELKVAKPSK
jgi:hypothetical protein